MPSFRELVPPLLCLSLLLSWPCLARATDDGEQAYNEACTSCHNAKTRPLEGTRLSREKWREAIERMEGLGAEVPSGKKLSALLDYLERTHAPSGVAPEDKK